MLFRAKISGMEQKGTVPGYKITASPVEDHRKQMRMQVWLPLGLTLLVALALVVLTIVGAVNESPAVNKWGNLSAVFVIIPVLLTMLVFLVIVGAAVYGMRKLLQKMPDWMLRLQLRMVRISLGVRRAADAATQPVMKTNTFSARVKRLWETVVRGK